MTRFAVQIFLSLCFVSLAASGVRAAEFGGCRFNSQTLQFKGTLSEQTACLLRKVRPKGSGADPQPIPAWLTDHVGKPAGLSAGKVIAYLNQRGIAEADVGGAVVKGDTPEKRYFVIHDTSYPEHTGSFPADINEQSYYGNKLTIWGDTAKRVNLVISRDGRSRTFNDWKATRELPAVKIERTNNVFAARKVMVHVENVQPRIKPPGSFAWIAPDPGFAPAQDKRLALAYVVASVRAGTWLVPAYHFNIDQGLPNGHDDPQKADLQGWTEDVAEIVQAIEEQ